MLKKLITSLFPSGPSAVELALTAELTALRAENLKSRLELAQARKLAHEVLEAAQLALNAGIALTAERDALRAELQTLKGEADAD